MRFVRSGKVVRSSPRIVITIYFQLFGLQDSQSFYKRVFPFRVENPIDHRTEKI